MDFCVNIFDKGNSESSCVFCNSVEDFILSNWKNDKADVLSSRLKEAGKDMKICGDNLVWEDNDYIYTMFSVNDALPKVTNINVVNELTQEEHGNFDNLVDWIEKVYFTREIFDDWAIDGEEDDENYTYEDSIDFLCKEISYEAEYVEDTNSYYWEGYRFTPTALKGD